MSDINDLIHSNARLAYEQGIKSERERITKLLTELPNEFVRKDEVERAIKVAIKRIQG